MSQILGHPRWPTTPLAFCAGRQPARKWKKAERSNLTQRDKPSTEIRNSVRVLKAQGQTLREISRLLKLSRNAVRRILRERECQSASNFDPRSASNFDPLERRVRAVALAPSELVGGAETARARVGES